ncbi:chemotaxis protein CheD [Salisediminibacterium selenitireducens]|uniref:Probable chemoreceptor glutamine deamidase CheD n=1 Tax=Bacillus selenitireducens (strain ATCC 700615 / DSM 15326 / MLS10) TaxID=439292 RepID=D6XTY9_BACIE|nr:chemotaxis protein CheD [Salisediminibacterium selenitireducens]ADH99275.1 CheD, stimulates methylation of MCP protein [[Bacillus] selenitireducens MLS10]
MSNVIKVGMADLNVVKPPDTIRTSGLGSCVGVIIYDERAKVAGMAHVMLPDSSYARNDKINRAKYADTAMEDLVDRVVAIGASKTRLKAKLAGGAQMFNFSSSNEAMRIGPRNAEAVKEHLKIYRIPVIYEDTGGSSGRTIEFDPESSELEIRTVNKGVVKV